MEVACRLDSLCVALGEQWSVVTGDILPALVADADPDVRCEVRRRDVRVLYIYSRLSGCYSYIVVAVVGAGAGVFVLYFYLVLVLVL